MNKQWFVAMCSAVLLALPVAETFAQSGYGHPGYGGGWYGGAHAGRGWGDHGRDNDRNGRDRDDRWRERRREGSVSIRSYRRYPAYVQLRDSRGRVRSSLWLSPGEHEYIRAEANSRWTRTVRQGSYTRRYDIDDLGSFYSGRWYVRLR